MATHCPTHCRPRVAREIRGFSQQQPKSKQLQLKLYTDLPSPSPSSVLTTAVSLECSDEFHRVATKDEGLARFQISWLFFFSSLFFISSKFVNEGEKIRKIYYYNISSFFLCIKSKSLNEHPILKCCVPNYIPMSSTFINSFQKK